MGGNSRHQQLGVELAAKWVSWGDGILAFAKIVSLRQHQRGVGGERPRASLFALLYLWICVT